MQISGVNRPIRFKVLTPAIVAGVFLLWYNMSMYLSEEERKEILRGYGCGDFVETAHYQVEPDTWVYLFRDLDDKKYVLISADYLDFEFDHFPHLLRFDNGEYHKIDFVLQREIFSRDVEKTSNSVLFEYAG